MNMHACKTVQRTNMKNVYANGVLFIFVAPIANLTITSWTKSNSNLILTNVLHNFSRYYYRAVVHIDNYLHINGFAFTHIYLYICLVLLAGVRWARSCASACALAHAIRDLEWSFVCLPQSEIQTKFATAFHIFIYFICIISVGHFQRANYWQALIFILFVLAPRCSFYYNVYLFG